MDSKRFFSITLALFYFHLSNCAPVFKGLENNTNALNESESKTDVYQPTSLNISEHNFTSNSTDSDLPSILHGKSTFKKIVTKVKNKITGGGGSNKGKTNKDGGYKGGGHNRIRRPIRPTNSRGGGTTFDYVMIGILGGALVLAIVIGCLVAILQKDDDENKEEENENADQCNAKGKEENNNEFRKEEKDKNKNICLVETTSFVN